MMMPFGGGGGVDDGGGLNDKANYLDSTTDQSVDKQYFTKQTCEPPLFELPSSQSSPIPSFN